MHPSTLPWIWLAVSLAAVLVVDLVFTRLLLQALRPTSAYAFLAARVAKLGAAFAWLAFFSTYWYPEFFGGGGTPPWMKPAVLTSGVLLLAAAVATRPRNRSAGNG